MPVIDQPVELVPDFSALPADQVVGQQSVGFLVFRLHTQFAQQLFPLRKAAGCRSMAA